MMHMNLRADLEAALRRMSSESGFSITTVCAALLSLGMEAKPKAIEARCALSARPMGRPLTSAPTLSDDTDKVPAPSDSSEKAAMAAYMMRTGTKKINIAKWRAGGYEGQPPPSGPAMTLAEQWAQFQPKKGKR